MNTHYHYFMEQLQLKVQLQEALLQELTLITKQLNLIRGAHLLYPGDTCKSVYFISDGFVRIYRMEDELETTINFAGKGDFVTIINSFFSQKSGNDGIICEKDSVLMRINYRDLMVLQELSTEFLKLNVLVLQDYLQKIYEEANTLRTANATQKYIYLCHKYPGIATMVNYKNIASYLGITPPTLSNLLKDLLK